MSNLPRRQSRVPLILSRGISIYGVPFGPRILLRLAVLYLDVRFLVARHHLLGR